MPAASTPPKPYPLAQATPINAQRGDVLFFSYFTLHGSLPNRSDNPRKTVLVQMYIGLTVVMLAGPGPWSLAARIVALLAGSQV